MNSHRWTWLTVAAAAGWVGAIFGVAAHASPSVTLCTAENSADIQANASDYRGLYTRGSALLEKGRGAAAQPLLEQAVNVADTDKALRAQALAALGEAYWVAGSDGAARETLEKSWKLARGAKATSTELEAMFGLTRLLLQEDRVPAPRAANQSARAKSLLRYIDRTSTRNGLTSFGIRAKTQLAASESDRAKAGAGLSTVVASLEAMPQSAEQAALALFVSDEAAKAGFPAQALAAATLSLDYAVSEGDVALEAVASGFAAAAYHKAGRLSDAQSMNARAVLLAELSPLGNTGFVWRGQQAMLQRTATDNDGALAAYGAMIDELSARDLYALADPLYPGWLRQQAEGYLLDYVDLLLADEGSDAKVADARQAIEILRGVEFAAAQNVCTSVAGATAASLATLPKDAAVLYPIFRAEEVDLIALVPAKDGGAHDLFRRRASVSPAQMALIAGELRWALRRPDRDVRASGGALYNALIAPFAEEFSRSGAETLVFAPEGPLRGVPIGTLYDEANASFLVEQYAIATVVGLSFAEQTPFQAKGARALVAGLSTPVETFSALPNVPSEVERIASAFDGRARVLLDASYSQENLTRSAERGDFRVFHFATHAKFTGRASDSFLLASDDRITLDELDDIASAAVIKGTPIDLLVLSACETAAGESNAVLGLAGAAYTAGARSVMATFWPIDDASTSDLIPTFYDELLNNGASRAKALRAAQMSLLQNERTAHPYYWGAFVLIGDWM